MFVKYGYFVYANGGIAKSGEDWGSSDDSYAIGQSLGVKNGKEGIVVALDKGEVAKGAGFGVLVLVDEVEPGKRSERLTTKSGAFLRGIAKILATQKLNAEHELKFGKVMKPVVINFRGKNLVGVGNKIIGSEKCHKFHDFLMDYVPILFEKKWFDEQVSLPKEKRHQLFLWRESAIKHVKTLRPVGDGRFQGNPNGAQVAYMSCAYDLFVIEQNGFLDADLLDRLKNQSSFQGARHEIFAEASCLRAGFEVVHEDQKDRTKKHAEFIARHRKTGLAISVEAKSRHRPGVLGFPGPRRPQERISRGLGKLLNDAVEKEPNKPIAVFLDTNLPFAGAEKYFSWQSIDPPVPPSYVLALINRVQQEHGGRDPWNFLALTNHPDQDAAAGEPFGNRSITLISEIPRIDTDNSVLMELHEGVSKYGNIPYEFPSRG